MFPAGNVIRAGLTYALSKVPCGNGKYIQTARRLFAIFPFLTNTIAQPETV